ncbi:TRAP transporter TatT component family protein, partial [Klebsiella pneumoniae]|uniref:TRAP transporter TatT component family protein n=1 Tax=Klebsiella pneumoniae TaxID=573 RepID=UPI003012A87E
IALVKRAYELDKEFNNAGPAMAMGVIAGSQGKAMGGDPDASKRYFEEALQATQGKYLMIKVLMARVYAVTVQDRALYERLLKEVIDA